VSEIAADKPHWTIFQHYPPFTCNLGFIRAEYREAKEFLTEWVRSQEPVPPADVNPVKCHRRGLGALAPRSDKPEFAFVLLDCADSWVMWQYRYDESVDPRMRFVNRSRGWTTVSATCVDDSNNLWNGKRVPNGTIFTYYEGGLTTPRTQRTIASAESGTGGFHWETYGDPLPFETPALYRVRRKQDRFSSYTLCNYLEALGILVRDPNFFAGDAFDFEM
jgi:hypothetical protein